MEPIHACSCVGPVSHAYALEHSDAVFQGEVISKNGLRSACGRSGEVFFLDLAVEFKVTTVWKGEINETTFINTNYDGAACGYPFRIGEEYIVYANQNEWVGMLGVGLCSRTGLAPDHQEDLEYLGEGWSPEPGSSDPTPIPPPEPREEQCPIPTPDPSAELSKPEALPATGGCAPLLAHTRLSLDATPLLLAVGIIWLTTRTRRRR